MDLHKFEGFQQWLPLHSKLLDRIAKNHSANRTLEPLGALLQMETPLILASSSAFANKEVKPSAHNRNKYSEYGISLTEPLRGKNIIVWFAIDWN